MRKDALEIISLHLFKGEDDQLQLAPSEQTMLRQIETTYTYWLDNPMRSDIEMRNYIMHTFDVKRDRALTILNYTIYALGNVTTAAKSFIKKKIDYLLTKATTAAEAGDLKYAQTLTKIAVAYSKAFETGVDDIDLSEIRKNFTINKVVIVNDASTIGVKPSGRDREQMKEMLRKYDIPEDEVLDTEYEEVNGN